jgi:hypothetical protein
MAKIKGKAQEEEKETGKRPGARSGAPEMAESEDGVATKELRRSLRARRPLGVTYANLTNSPGPGYQYNKSAIVDLSDTGLGLIVEEKIKKGDLLQVVIQLPVRPFVVTGLAEAIWVRSIAGGTRYRAGLRFVQLTSSLTERVIRQLS